MKNPSRLVSSRRGWALGANRLRGLALLAAFAVPVPAFALHMADLPRLVADHNRDVMAAKRDIAAAEHSRNAARAKYFPKVDWTTTYSHLDGKIELDVGTLSTSLPLPGRDPIPISVSPPPIEIQEQDFWKSTLTAVQPLYAGGRITAANEAAEAAEREAFLNANALHDEQTRNATIRYFQAQQADEVVKVLKDMEANLKSLHGLSQKLVESGMVPKFSIMQIEVAEAELAARLEEAKARHTLALTALQIAIGAAVGDVGTLEDPLKLVPCGEGLDHFQKKALANRSELKILHEKAKSVEALRDAQRGEMMPSLAAFGKFEVIDKYLTALEPSWVAGLNLSIPLTAGLEKWPEMQKAEELAEKVSILQLKAREEIPLQVQAFHTEVRAQGEILKAVDSGIAQAQEALRIAKKRFETGQGSTMEVLQASNDVEKMRLKQIEVLENYNRNLVSLYAAAGDVHGYATVYQSSATTKESK